MNSKHGLNLVNQMLIFGERETPDYKEKKSLSRQKTKEPKLCIIIIIIIWYYVGAVSGIILEGECSHGVSESAP